MDVQKATPSFHISSVFFLLLLNYCIALDRSCKSLAKTSVVSQKPHVEGESASQLTACPQTDRVPINLKFVQFLTGVTDEVERAVPASSGARFGFCAAELNWPNLAAGWHCFSLLNLVVQTASLAEAWCMCCQASPKAMQKARCVAAIKAAPGSLEARDWTARQA